MRGGLAGIVAKPPGGLGVPLAPGVQDSMAPALLFDDARGVRGVLGASLELPLEEGPPAK
jgi:hypothetical protein